MLFKNYLNRVSKSNRIYTKPEIREMKLKDFFKQKKEFVAQYEDIGLPKLDDLKNSPNVVYVEDPNEVFGGRWESVLPGGTITGGAAPVDLKGVNEVLGFDPQATPPDVNGVNGVSSNSADVGNMAGVAAPVLEGGVKMDVNSPSEVLSPEMQKFNEELQKQVKLGANSYIINSGPEITERKLYISKRKPTLKDKYKGLTPLETFGKAFSKLPIPWTASQYYGHSAHLADDESPSWLMKRWNDFYKYGDIPNSDPKKSLYREQAAKMLKLDINDPDLETKISDVPIVVPKAGSAINRKIKDSLDLENYVGEHYDEIMSGQGVDGTIEFQSGNDFNLWAVIHRADANVDKNSNDINIEDINNYELWKYAQLFDSQKRLKENLLELPINLWNNAKAALNNMAFSQQEAGKLANYILSVPIDLSDEEIQQIYESYKNKQFK